MAVRAISSTNHKSTLVVAAVASLLIVTTTFLRRSQQRLRDDENVWSLAGDHAQLTSVLPAGTKSKDDAPKLLTTVTRAVSTSSRRRSTVVFLHGFGCLGALEFGLVAQRVARELHVDAVTVDRIVMMEGALPQPRTAHVLAQELMTVLENRRDLQPPYVLVGHSYGGLIAQVAAEWYNKESLISGLVLLDPAHQDQFQALPRDFSVAMHLSPFLFRIYQYLLAPLGWLSLLDACNQFVFPPLYLISCPKTRRTACALYSRPQAWKHVLDEWNACLQTFDQRQREETAVQSQPLPPGVLVLAEHRQYSPTLYPQAITDAFVRLHQPLIDHPNWELVMADQSDHWIHLQQPQLVVQAIRSVLQKTTTQ